MKKTNPIFILAIVLSAGFVLIEIWDGFTRPLGSKFDPDETRYSAIVSSLIFTGIVSLILFGLIYALRKNKLIAVIGWVLVAPTLLMLGWDTITKNLVERGIISASWLTDSAYKEAHLHRNIWILGGIIVATPFLYNFYRRLSSLKR